MPVDEQIAQLLQVIEASPSMTTMTPEEARHAFRSLTCDARQPDQVVPVGAVEESVVAGRPARVYRPAHDGEVARPLPTVLLFHGGGFVIGDLDTHDNLARTICRDVEAVVVSLDYRLAPESPFPAAADDCEAAARELLADLSSYGGGEVLAVAGDSAGGNLAAVVSQQVPGIAAQLLLYPAVDVAGEYPSREENGEGYFLDLPTMEWFIGNYAPDRDYDDPRLSPIKGVSADLPPAVVVTAEFDPLRDEGAAYAEALEDAGVRAVHLSQPGMIHGFMDMGMYSPGAQRAIETSIQAFGELLRGL